MNQAKQQISDISSQPKKKDCEESVCYLSAPGDAQKRYDSIFDSMSVTLTNLKLAETGKAQGSKTANKNQVDQELERKIHMNCPNNKETLGYFSWNFLHTTSIYYPDNPEEKQQKQMLSFLKNFARFYPCTECGEGFYKYMAKNKPDTKNGKELSIWLCKAHNFLNKYLGKPIYDCSYDNLEKRWKTGFDYCPVTHKLDEKPSDDQLIKNQK